jgi:hypothetical protein
MYSFAKFLADHIFLQNRDRKYIYKKIPIQWTDFLAVFWKLSQCKTKQAMMAVTTMK